MLVNVTEASPLATVIAWLDCVAAFQLVLAAASPRTVRVPTALKVTTPFEMLQIADDAAAIVNVTATPPVEVAVGV